MSEFLLDGLLVVTADVCEIASNNESLTGSFCIGFMEDVFFGKMS